MEVEYEITPDDLYAFQWRAAYASPRAWRTRRKAYVFWLVSLLIISVLPAIGTDGFSISRVNYTFFLIAFPLAALGQWFLERRLIRRALLQLLQQERPGRGQLGRHRLVLTDAGLAESTDVGESRTTWAGVHRLEENPEYIFIYTAAAAAHVIPKRAFRDEQEAERFYQFSKTRKEVTS
jgi:hypothetical protein